MKPTDIVILLVAMVCVEGLFLIRDLRRIAKAKHLKVD